MDGREREWGGPEVGIVEEWMIGETGSRVGKDGQE